MRQLIKSRGARCSVIFFKLKPTLVGYTCPRVAYESFSVYIFMSCISMGTVF